MSWIEFTRLDSTKSFSKRETLKYDHNAAPAHFSVSVVFPEEEHRIQNGSVFLSATKS